MGKILVLLSLLFTWSSQAQLDTLKPYVVFSGYIADSSNKRLPDVTITVIEGEDTLANLITKSNGKYYKLGINQGKIVSVNFSKEGFIPKRVLIDGETNYFESDTFQVIPMDMPIILDTKKEGFSYADLENEFYIGKLIIDPATAGLTIDLNFSSAKRKEYDQLLNNPSKK